MPASSGAVSRIRAVGDDGQDFDGEGVGGEQGDWLFHNQPGGRGSAGTRWHGGASRTSVRRLVVGVEEPVRPAGVDEDEVTGADLLALARAAPVVQVDVERGPGGMVEGVPSAASSPSMSRSEAAADDRVLGPTLDAQGGGAAPIWSSGMPL